MAIKVEVPPLEYVITIDHAELVQVAVLVERAVSNLEGCRAFWVALPEEIRAEVRRAKGYF